MKMDWAVKGAVKFDDDTVEPYEQTWTEKTAAEVESRMDTMMSRRLRKTDVVSVAFTATADGPKGKSVIAKATHK